MSARFAAASLAACLLVVAACLAGPARSDDIEVASSDCQSAANRVVARTGGQLLSVSAGREGGQAVCRITVLVQGGSHKRPRKMTVTVPQ